jgi:homoserine dehydrogenase
MDAAGTLPQRLFVLEKPYSSEGESPLNLRLALVGFGNVAREFSRLLLSKREWLLKERGLSFEVVAVASKSRGSLMSEDGLDLERALKLREESGTLLGYDPESTDLSTLKIIGGCGADLMVELTTLDIGSGMPATDHIRAALRAGMSVVTANKGPVAFAYDELSSLARSRGAFFRFEGTVMDGAPVFSLVERTLPGCEVTGIRGLLNTTTNLVLGEMARGASMDEALEEARRRGVTEEDPSMDIDGWDAAAKIAALANVLMGAGTNPRMVDRTGIRGVSTGDAVEAAGRGMKHKLIASAERSCGVVRTSVRPELVGPDDPFWSVDGTSSAVTLETDLMGELTIVERNPTLAQTAYAVFSDILLIADAFRN